MSLIDRFKNNKKIKQFINHVYKRFTDADITTSSAAIAYYLLLSIFPLVIAIGNILPYLKINQEKVLSYIASILPGSIYLMLEGTFRSLLEKSNSGLLSLSAIATLWAASLCINALQKSLNKAYGVGGRTNMLITRLFSFLAIFLFLIAIVVIVIFFSIGQTVLDYFLPILQLPVSISGAFGTLKWPVTVFSLFIVMSFIYLVLPNAKVRLRSVIPGAFFSTVGWMTLTQFFGLYVRYFSRGLTGYGVIGTFIVFMLWLNLASTMIVLGGVINAIIEESFTGTIQPRDSRLKKIRKYVKEKGVKKE